MQPCNDELKVSLLVVRQKSSLDHCWSNIVCFWLFHQIVEWRKDQFLARTTWFSQFWEITQFVTGLIYFLEVFTSIFYQKRSSWNLSFALPPSGFCLFYRCHKLFTSGGFACAMFRIFHSFFACVWDVEHIFTSIFLLKCFSWDIPRVPRKFSRQLTICCQLVHVD